MIDRSFPDSAGAHGCMLQLHSAHLPSSMQTAMPLQCVLCLAMDTRLTATFNTLALLHMIHVLVCVLTLVAQRPMYSHLCPPCSTLCSHTQWFLEQIKKEPMLQLVGVHSHLGSTITKVRTSVGAGLEAWVVRRCGLGVLQIRGQAGRGWSETAWMSSHLCDRHLRLTPPVPPFHDCRSACSVTPLSS